MFPRWANERTYKGQPLKLHFIDIRKAYFNARPKRDLYVRLPSELGLGRNVVGKLQRCMYGTRDAGALWELTYANALLEAGFVQGRSGPCCVYHTDLHLSLVVHLSSRSLLIRKIAPAQKMSE